MGGGGRGGGGREGNGEEREGGREEKAKWLRKIVLVSLIVLLRELLVSTIFRMVHPYIGIHSFLHL